LTQPEDFIKKCKNSGGPTYTGGDPYESTIIFLARWNHIHHHRRCWNLLYSSFSFLPRQASACLFSLATRSDSSVAQSHVIPICATPLDFSTSFEYLLAT
jgi:hypothetical protein